MLYAEFATSLEHMWMLQQHKCKRLVAFLEMCSMFWLKLNLLSILTPK